MIQMPDFSAGLGYQEVRFPRNLMHVESGGRQGSTPGTIRFADTTVQSIDIVFVTYRKYRILYAADYRKDPKAPAVCGSWNGRDAFGRGSRDPAAPLQERQCAVLEGGRVVRTCPSDSGRGDEWICRPRFQYLVLGWLNGVWVPAFWEVSGMQCQPVEEGYMRVLARASMSGGRQPLFLQRVSVAVKKADKGRTGFLPVIGEIKPIVDPIDAEELKGFVLKNANGWSPAVAMWEAEIARSKQFCYSIGKPKDGEDPPEKAVDFAEIPF